MAPRAEPPVPIPVPEDPGTGGRPRVHPTCASARAAEEEAQSSHHRPAEATNASRSSEKAEPGAIDDDDDDADAVALGSVAALLVAMMVGWICCRCARILATQRERTATTMSKTETQCLGLSFRASKKQSNRSDPLRRIRPLRGPPAQKFALGYSI
jgi:hypothetical protein